MPRKPVIAVVGSGRDVEPAGSNARAMGRLMAANGWVLITGGRNTGVMRAANEGANEVEGGLTIGILPNKEADVSPAVDVAIITDVGEARNNVIVLSADVIIACGVEGAGTASEVSLAIKNGKHVVLLEANDAATHFFTGIDENLIHLAATPEEAISLVKSLLARRTR